MKRTRNERGTTLVELMISLGIVSIVMVFVYSFFLQQRAILKKQRTLAEVSQYSMTSVDVLSRSIVNAGYNLKRGTALEAASDHYLVMTADQDGNGWISPNEVIAFGASKTNNPATGTEAVLDCDTQAPPAIKKCGFAPMQFSFYSDSNNNNVVEENEKKTYTNFRLQLDGPPYTLYRYHFKTGGSVATTVLDTPDAVENNLEYLVIYYKDMNGKYLGCPNNTVRSPTNLCVSTVAKPALPYYLTQLERKQVRKIEIEFMTRASATDVNVTAKGLPAKYMSSGTYPVGSIATYSAAGAPNLGALTYKDDGYLRKVYNVEVTPRNFVTDICGRVLMSLQSLTVPCEWDTSFSPNGSKRHMVTAKVTDLYGEPLLNTTITFNISSKFGSFANPLSARLTQTQVSSGSTGSASVYVYHYKVPPEITKRSDMNFLGPTNVSVNASFVDDVNFNPACTAASSINAPFVPGPPVRVAFVKPNPVTADYPLYEPDDDGKYPIDHDDDHSIDQVGGVDQYGTLTHSVADMYPELTAPIAASACGAGDDSKLAVMGVEIQDACGNPTTLGMGGVMRRLRLKPLMIPSSGTLNPTTAAKGRIRAFVDDATGWHVWPQEWDTSIVIKDPGDPFTAYSGPASSLVNYPASGPLVISYMSPTFAHVSDYGSMFTGNSLNLIYSPFFYNSPTQAVNSTLLTSRYIAGVFIDPSVSDLGSAANSLVNAIRYAPVTYATPYYETQWPIIAMEAMPTNIIPPQVTMTQANSIEQGLGSKPNNDGWIDIKSCGMPVTETFSLTDSCNLPVDIAKSTATGITINLSLTGSLADNGHLSPNTITLGQTTDFTYISPLTFSGTDTVYPTIKLSLINSSVSTTIPISSVTLAQYLGGIGIYQCSGDCIITSSNFAALDVVPPVLNTTQCQQTSILRKVVSGVTLPNQITLQDPIIEISPSSLASKVVFFDKSMNTYIISSATANSITTLTPLATADATATFPVNIEIYDPACFTWTQILERSGPPSIGTPLVSTVGTTSMLTPCTANVWVNFGGCEAQSTSFPSVEVLLEPTWDGAPVNRNASLGDIHYTTGGDATAEQQLDSCTAWRQSGPNQPHYDALYPLLGSQCFKIPVSLGDATGWIDGSGNYYTTNIGVRAYFPNRAACSPSPSCSAGSFEKCTTGGVTCYRPGVIKVTSECRQVSACQNNTNCQGASEIFNNGNILLNGCSPALTFKVYDCNRNKNKTVQESISASGFKVTLSQGAIVYDTEYLTLVESTAETHLPTLTITVWDSDGDTWPDPSVNSPLFAGRIDVNMSANTVAAYGNGQLNIPYGQSAVLNAYYVDPDDYNDNKCTMQATANWITPFCTYGCLNAFDCAYPSMTQVMTSPSNNQMVFSNVDCALNTDPATRQFGLILVVMGGLTKEAELVVTSEVAGTFATPVISLAGTYPTFVNSADSGIFAGTITVKLSAGVKSNNSQIDIKAGTAVPGTATPVTLLGTYTISGITLPSTITVTGTPWTTNQLVGSYLYIPTIGNLYTITANTNHTVTVNTAIPVVQAIPFANLTTGTSFSIGVPKPGCSPYSFSIAATPTQLFNDDFQACTVGGTVWPSNCNKWTASSGTERVAWNALDATDKEASLSRTAGSSAITSININATGKSNLVVSGWAGSDGAAGVTTGELRYCCATTDCTVGTTPLFTRTTSTTCNQNGNNNCQCFGLSTDGAPSTNGTCGYFSVNMPAACNNKAFVRIQLRQATVSSTARKGLWDDIYVWGF